MMIFNQGDECTFRLTERQAAWLNGKTTSTCFSCNQIVSHKPVPKPVIGFTVPSHAGRFTTIWEHEENARNWNGCGTMPIIKITYDPVTNTVSAEVLK